MLNGSATFSIGVDQANATDLRLQCRKADNTNTGSPLSAGITGEGMGVFSFFGTVPNDAKSAKLYRLGDATAFAISALVLTDGSGNPIEPPDPSTGLQPLFIYDRTRLLSTLRLSGVPSNADAQAMIDEAISAARVRLYSALTTTRVATLQSIAYSDTPTNDLGILRLKAALAESAMIRATLLRKMPTLFIDGSAVVREVFNEEPLSRHVRSETDIEIDRLEDEIDAYLADIGDEPEEDAGSIKVSSIGPTCPVPRPGDSVRAWPEIFQGRRGDLF